MAKKKKIAILGGGMSGLSAAYQLSLTADLRSSYEVTVYQMGWRLGGKAASGRDELGRNVEHGLHVWFGCYHNVFAMMREVYAAWRKPAGCPLQTVDDVAHEQAYTPIGVRNDDGTWSWFPMHWPGNAQQPGTGTPALSADDAFAMLVDLFHDTAQSMAIDLGLPVLDQFPQANSFHAFTSHGSTMAGLLAGRAHVQPEGAHAVIGFFEAAYDAFQAAVAIAMPAYLRSGHPLGVKLRIVRDLFDIMVAAIRGYYLDLAIPHLPFEAIDDWDFRDWLVHHGASPGIVRDSSITHILYDTMFQYADGDVSRPSYAAGTALGVVTRLVTTYKGSLMWDIQAGMGEAVVAPLYDVLKSRGIAFRFFHKVKRLDLATDGSGLVDRVAFDVQAEAIAPEYDPIVPSRDGKLRCWPHEPVWSRLKNGGSLGGTNFESHWCARAPVREAVLDRNAGDFDEVVIAMALGAYKPLNAVDASPCAQLMAHDLRFEQFVTRQSIVPSQGVQLWSDRTTAELGWTTGKAAVVGGPQYLNIWADMTQVIDVEDWSAGSKPRSLHYLTGTFATTLYREPSTDCNVPGRAVAQLRAGALTWLDRDSRYIFPSASTPAGFDYGVLTAAAGLLGPARFDAQFLRANIDPTECCVASFAGTTRYRLHPRDHGFANVVLAGEASRHGFNTTTIEGAVMSGMAAARAISGQPPEIVGYDFLTTPH